MVLRLRQRPSDLCLKEKFGLWTNAHVVMCIMPIRTVPGHVIVVMTKWVGLWQIVPAHAPGTNGTVSLELEYGNLSF